MKFKKDGKVYANIDALLHEACPKGGTGCYRENCAIRNRIAAIPMQPSIRKKQRDTLALR